MFLFFERRRKIILSYREKMKLFGNNSKSLTQPQANVSAIEESCNKCEI